MTLMTLMTLMTRRSGADALEQSGRVLMTALEQSGRVR
jgi:hypothetical protein